MESLQNSTVIMICKPRAIREEQSTV